MRSIEFILDTNVLVQCKNFTQIRWEKVFDEKFEKITLIIPYMVMKELDELKHKNYNALKAMNRIRDIELGKLNINLFSLKSSDSPPVWEKLSDSQKQYLSSSDPDHQILAEILLNHQQLQELKVVFVTGDYLPTKIAKRFDIDCLYWLDDEFKKLFEKEKIIISKPEALEIYFFNEGKFSKEISLNKIIASPIPLRIEEYNQDYDTPPSHPLIGHKTKENLQHELDNYNDEMDQYYRFKEILFIVQNNSNNPFTNIDVYLEMVLEKGFKVKYRKDKKVPEKPKISRRLMPLNTIRFSPSIKQEPNVKYSEIISVERERNNDWIIQNHISKIKHNETETLFPLLIWIPKDVSTEQINIKISFTQDQEGKIKEQNLSIILK
jgi:rRNA-processing protein FCF1